MKTTKKLLAVLLSVLMLLPVFGVAAFAATTYTVTFKDLMDTVPGNDTFMGDGQQSFILGEDYWFEIISVNGEKFEEPQIVKSQTDFSVNAGRYVEFTVGTKSFPYVDQMSYMNYVQYIVAPTSVKVLAFNDADAARVFPDAGSAKADNTYFIPGSDEIYEEKTIYAVKPSADMTVGVSEFDMRRDCFLPKLPSSKYHSAARVQYNPAGSIQYGIKGNNAFVNYTDYTGAGRDVDTTVNTKYVPFDHDNTKVTYDGESIYVALRIPTNDASHTYNYDSYKMTVSYMKLDGTTDSYVLTPADKVDRFYENGDSQVDIYKIDGMRGEDYVTLRFMKVKVSGTVKFTFSMIRELLDGIANDEIALEDLGEMDIDPIVEWITRLVALIRKLLKGFGVG